MSHAELHSRLNQHFRNDGERRAFLLDYFPAVGKRASASLDEPSLWNLLFELQPIDAIERAFLRHQGMSADAATDPRPVHGFQLPPLDSWFSGRRQELAEIDRLLTAHRGLTLQGLGGLGKSSLARKYLHCNRHRFSFVGWLSAADAASLEGDYVSLAGFLDRYGLSRYPAPSVTEPKARLAFVMAELDHLSDWLLVLDNADHPEALDALWPSVERGFVLVTSRQPDAGRFPLYEVPPWDPEEALAFLRTRADQPLLGPAETAARMLLAEVEALPLAVEQVAAYLAQHKTPIARYMRAFQKERTRLFPRLPGTERRSIATVWSMSFSEVETESPAAADLLRVSAYLSPDGIPEWFLAAGSASLGEALHAALSPENPLAVDEVLGPLLRHSLVRRSAAEDSESRYSLHRLVQDVVRQHLRNTHQEDLFIERAVTALSQAFPDVTGFPAWSHCRALLPSVESLWPRAQHLETLAAALLWSEASAFLGRQARYTEAEAMCHRSLSIREKLLGPDHADVAECLNNLAGLFHERRMLADAEPLYRRSLAIGERTLGPDHPDVAPTLNNLACLLDERGMSAEAEPLHRRSLEICEKASGPDHLGIAVNLNNQASRLNKRGHAAKAELLYRRSLELTEKALGPDHPNVAEGLNNLAILLHKQGKPAEAELLYRRGLEISEKELGPGHPQVASSLSCLATLLYQQDKFSEAEPLFRRSLEIREKILGPDSPQVGITLNNLASLLENQGRPSEAEPLFRRSLEISEKNLGLEHPELATRLNNLATLLHRQGRCVEAKTLYRRSLAIRKKVLGPDHLSTKRIREKLRLLREGVEG